MKRATLGLALVLVGLAGSVWIVPRAWSRVEDPGFPLGLTNWLGLSPGTPSRTAGPQASVPLRFTNMNPVIPGKRFGTNWVFGTTNRQNAPFAPGLYRSEPYTCLVLVPDRGIDEKSVVDPGKTASPMPLVKPELKLVPVKPGGK